jgi:transcriptional regulator with XRE-family HTH domain
MREVGITQAQLARDANVSEGQLSKYRAGTTIPDPATLRKLEKPLDADFDEMMVLAGHAKATGKRHAETYIVRTEDPRVHRLLRVVSEVSTGQRQKDIERALRVLKAVLDENDD